MVGSDSGRIAILEFNAAKTQFDRIHLETFGKSGCRRIVPGQYLAIDPKGRAVMIGELGEIIPVVRNPLPKKIGDLVIMECRQCRSSREYT